MTVRIEKPAINVREELADLRKPSGVAGEAMLRADTPQEQFNLIGAGRRNILYNGGFTVSQRGDYTSATAITNNNYYLDRWNMDFQGINAVIENNTADLPNGNTVKTAKIRATGSGTGYMQIRQKIEVESWMQGREVTLSAWVKSNSSYPRFRIEGAAIGGNEDGTQTHSGNGQWEFLTFTTTLADGFSFFHAGVVLWNGSTVAVANNDYMEIAQVQLEVGKVATPFEHRSYGEELAACQRYYEILAAGINNSASNTGNLLGNFSQYSSTLAIGIVPYKVTKRAVPTGIVQGATSFRVYSDGGNSTATAVNVDGDTSLTKARIDLTVSRTVGHALWVRGQGNACLIAVDAEL